ncbi:endoplasmic reticulum mannosyl-oligosaccharide 1,2-alpha-mannosidase isoform X6 [Nilaparvata lugens]|uniref:endoplasmic reticulum mannosyl-oligosaccharide 1,2-alpha-mannosidase isoform X6 n=1 Tax=Nilaparvata lugens TaxID=108931 RepID=UPI00193D2C20|nr:endoplasmic reticulum mannosyl-oligosaccharide 1,2-alpha-mannosidase isoform X6 [Nilaparvata lugens]
MMQYLMSMVTAIGVVGVVAIIHYWSVLKLGVEPLIEIEKNGLASEPAPVLANEKLHPQDDAQIAQPDHPQDNVVMEDWVGQVAPPEDLPNRGVEFPPPTTDRQRAVVGAFMHAWNGYRKFAWGHDHLKPVSGSFKDWFHLGLSITESLDTMYIMGLKEEFEEAKGWVRDSLKFNTYHEVNLFEVTIRVLGGLLSAYHLSGDRMFLDKADVAFNVSKYVHNLPKTNGLVPIYINPNTGQFHYSEIKLGARGDSYYEYLLKQWIQTGKTIDFLKDDYLEAVEGIKKWLVRRTLKSDLLFIGELRGRHYEFVPEMDHLVCYLPGTLALGYHNGLPEDHLKLALDLMETCYQTYAQRPTFLAPERSSFSIQSRRIVIDLDDIYVNSKDAHNLLRPEFIESLWYLYQITGNTTYQDWGWNIFKAFEKYSKVAHGFTSIGNVNNVTDTKPRDIMETFFLSETIKYLYLLFSNDRKLLDIDRYVINSEGHPLPIRES